MTVLLMWLLPLCSVINSGLELLVIPGKAPKISRRWDYNGENNSIYAEKDVHHIPPAQRDVRHHQVLSVAASAPPKRSRPEARILLNDALPLPLYQAAFPYDPLSEIPVPPPEQAC